MGGAGRALVALARRRGACKLIPANQVFDFTKITLDSNPIRNKNPLHIRVVGFHLKGALLF